MSHSPSHNGSLSEGEGPGNPCVNPLAQQPFRFDHLRGSPIKDASGDGGSDHQPSPHQPPRAEIAIDIRETKASISSIPLTFPRSWVQE